MEVNVTKLVRRHLLSTSTLSIVDIVPKDLIEIDEQPQLEILLNQGRGSKVLLKLTERESFDVARGVQNTTPNMPIMEAIRISCSIPFLLPFCMHGGEVCVDGAIMRYFPYEELDDIPNHSKIGVCILGADRILGKELNMYAYFCMLLAAALRLCPAPANDECSILRIKTKPEKTLPGAAEIERMVARGNAEMATFIKIRAKAKPD
ncbi:hypothetical protein KFL_006340030 [Klebsormidium nitens]|uniref:Patatin n=1 Tax=Klebsormidium nitens TaxID=105231 RepID=A0A1Y1II48_KLENI|nr:hypothetical protein KFL_006340030 [Klebsormidium nitens]|eukprot:GAQ90383.1 hypothetical protein KFL_006340030 [Klebsormidium nitens]